MGNIGPNAMGLTRTRVTHHTTTSILAWALEHVITSASVNTQVVIDLLIRI
jgi:hypothetical protein